MVMWSSPRLASEPWDGRTAVWAFFHDRVLEERVFVCWGLCVRVMTDVAVDCHTYRAPAPRLGAMASDRRPSLRACLLACLPCQGRDVLLLAALSRYPPHHSPQHPRSYKSRLLPIVWGHNSGCPSLCHGFSTLARRGARRCQRCRSSPPVILKWLAAFGPPSVHQVDGGGGPLFFPLRRPG